MALHKQLLQLPRNQKRLLMALLDTVALPFAIWCALALRLSTWAVDPTPYWLLCLTASLIGIPVFAYFGLYRTVIRYMGHQAAGAVLKGVTLIAVALIIVSKMVPPDAVMPRSVFIIFWLLALLYVGGSRFLIRSLYYQFVMLSAQKEPVIIYGAGDAGVQLATGLLKGQEYVPVAFIDDNQLLVGGMINDIEVLSVDDIGGLIDDFSVRQVLLALPSLSRVQRQKVLQRLEPYPVHVRTVPHLPDLISGKVKIEEIQEVDVEDLLGRDKNKPDHDLLCDAVEGKSVLVTGAAGSIGSELCRQIVRCRPKQLLLFEVSEYGLYKIQQELRAELMRRKIELTPLLGSVQDQALLEEVLSQFSVDVIFHAAAYKHVPLVEHNIIEGVKNNVLGTLAAAKAADIAGVDKFVLVSTDKAVRPTNIMGATKRVAELILQGLAQRSSTCFCMVRFGNVLDSSGSVVPLFREQIQQGGPVTVTHPEVSRYFMTIPEAAQLVIQAGALAEGGDVFVLDMGEQIKIVELARKMIRLMGYEVKDDDASMGDIAIEYSGLRPGEKLMEELWIGNDLAGTQNPKIMRAREEALSLDQVVELLQELEQACIRFDCETIKTLLLKSVSGFQPETEFVDEIWRKKNKPLSKLS